MSSTGLNSTTVLELTVSVGKLFHTGIFLKASKFALTDLLALGFFQFQVVPS